MQNSNVITALEQGYDAIKKLHPELPDAVILISPTSKAGRNTKLGHWFQNSWVEPKSRAKSKTRHELLISAESLGRGADEVFETLLHEAAHALATSRKQKDVTGYQYHNKVFKSNAEELGLKVEKMKNRGFAYTELVEATREKYVEPIKQLADAIKGFRQVTPKTGRSQNTQVKMICACGVTFRIGKRMAEAASILCEGCGHHFHPANDHGRQAKSLNRDAV